MSQVDQIPNTVTSVAFGLGGDVITGDSGGRIFVWSRDSSSDAFVVDKHASDSLRRAHEVRPLDCASTWTSAFATPAFERAQLIFVESYKYDTIHFGVAR